MFATLFSLSLLLLVIRSVFAQSDLTISTPVFVQCQLAQINWTDTCGGPYELLLASASDMCGVALVDLGYQNATSTTWTVSLAAGTQVILYVADSQGNDAWSGIITVSTSNDTSCLTNSTTPTTTPSTPTVSPSTATASSPKTSSSSLPAANAGLSSNSGTLSTHPVSAIALLGTTVLAVVSLAL